MKYWDETTIDKIRKGYYTAVYFNRTKQILLAEKNFKVATMQIFQKNEKSILCGIDEVIELLRVGVGYWDPTPLTLQGASGKWISTFDNLRVESLTDGDTISAWETVMHISGPYAYFIHLESLYLGILARRTLVATKTKKAVEAAHGKRVVFFADRFDHFLNQEGDGYAASVGGAKAVATQAQTSWWQGEATGTIPHALIAVSGGNTVDATLQFARHIKGAKAIALVDFDNDCVKTSIKVARVLKDKLWGVRLDTAENIVDVSLSDRSSVAKNLYGVNPTLVQMVRKALDEEGFDHVKIVVSGGFDEEKIKWFEKEKAPVDMYGVGSALVHGSNDFTADIVKVEGKPIAKAGREFKANPRLKYIH